MPYSVVDCAVPCAIAVGRPLSDDERALLASGVGVWSGPMRASDELARLIGYADSQATWNQRLELVQRLRTRGPVTKREWAQALRALEIAFGSDYYGAGVEWSIVTRWTDEQTLPLLRRIQRVLVGVRH